MNFYEGVLGQHACLIHDPAAVIAITDPHYFTFDEIPLRVIADGEEVGATMRDDTLGRRPVRVATAVNSEGVRKTFLDICKETDRMKKSRIAVAS
jgi:inosine-uridine nucleoside N-ribohydrolase